MAQESSVLLIEDEPEIRRFLRNTLPHHGYRLYEAVSGADGLAQAQARNPDLVLVDLGLPDMDGLDLIRKLREWTQTPIIVLSARGQEQVKVTALDGGADDYMTKPFGVEELLARLRTALRHSARSQVESGEGEIFTSGDLKIDLVRRHVYVGEKEMHLTPIEYKLLATLAKHAGLVMTHRQLLKEVWGPLHVEESQYLRVYMRQLRHKLEVDPARPRYLLTELGVGYRLSTA
ncbi:MAG TPA: response regulator [Candidatus Polarisedimenticolia bacterium]|nr:response regulator [Candidatus Polarisedimenticolia bacterium]